MSEKPIIIFKYPIHLLELALDWAMLYRGGSNVTNVTFVPNAPSKGVESQKKCHILEHL